jgi:hypothetical protein
VPGCQAEGREPVVDGMMCLRHALEWDRANEAGEVFTPELFIAAGEEAPDDEVAADAHAQWFGRAK